MPEIFSLRTADARPLDRRDDAGALVTGRSRGDLLCQVLAQVSDQRTAS
jgi:hypothetical protein